MNRRTTTLFGALASAAALAAGGTTLPAEAQPIPPVPAAAAAVQHPTAYAAASAYRTHTVKLALAPSSPALAACFPHASARVGVALTTEKKGRDTFTIKARGLKPRTDFTVFLLEQSGAPFGAAEYIGDFTTDKHGKGDGSFKLIVEEAFAFDNAKHTRTDLNAVGVWFADPKDDDGCLGPASPVTGFDGDAEAGVQMLSSGTHLLP